MKTITLLKEAWQDPIIQEKCSDLIKLGRVSESIQYFVKRLDSIFYEFYLPNEMDVLLQLTSTISPRSRGAITGVETKTVAFQDINLCNIDVIHTSSLAYNIVDSSWFKQISGLHTIVFMASLADFNLISREGGNLLVNTITLFQDIITKLSSKRHEVILLLNKRDIFEEKLKNNVDIATFFPNYKGLSGFASKIIFSLLILIRAAFRGKGKCSARLGLLYKQVYRPIRCWIRCTHYLSCH